MSDPPYSCIAGNSKVLFTDPGQQPEGPYFGYYVTMGKTGAQSTHGFAGSTGVGGTVHLGMIKLEKLSGLQLRHVTYKGKE